jgi:hypothetical protein
VVEVVVIRMVVQVEQVVIALLGTLKHQVVVQVLNLPYH